MTETNKNILVNDLLVPKVDCELKHVSIVIHIDPDNDQIFLLGLGKKSKPKSFIYSEVLDLLLSGGITKGKFDQTEYWKKAELFIKENELKKRDQKFQVIKPLLDDLHIFLGPNSYGKKLVSSCVEIAIELGMKATRDQVYQWLCRYLQSGKNINAFLRKPGTGKSNNKTYANKTGPKRQEGEICNGKMRDDTDNKNIKTILNEFHFCKAPLYLTECFIEYKNKFQSDEIFDQYTGEFVEYRVKQGVKHISDDQFLIYARQVKKKNPKKLMDAQGTTDEYNKNVRGLSGDIHTYFGEGPGSDYQIDETPLAIELVDEFDRDRRLGRPTCYSVIDMFSRSWVGILLTFAKASAHTAREIVFIACRNKEKFCMEIGVTLNELWPPEGKCRRIIVDNAEFASALTDAFSSDANIEVIFNKEGNSQEKGLVERRHKTLEEFLYGRIPGAVSKKQVQDYLKRRVRKDAVLNIRELYQILIDYITRFNNYYPLKTLPLSKEMKEDGVKKIPIEKWNWGLTHRAGHLQAVDEHDLYMRLLESGKVTVKRYGLFLQGKYIRTFKNRKTSKGLLYKCDWALSNLVYETQVGETYDCKFMRYSMSKIWIITEFGFQEATLAPVDDCYEWWGAEQIQDGKNKEAKEDEEAMNKYNHEQNKTKVDAKSMVKQAKREQSDITANSANNQDLSFNRDLAIEREIDESKKQFNKNSSKENIEDDHQTDSIKLNQDLEEKTANNEIASLFAAKRRKNKSRKG